jgi:polyisoprenoid-binding protein YceI
MARERWRFDPKHSVIGFRVRHLMIANVHGRFERWEGAIEIDRDEPERSRIELAIDASSIDTREPQRDAHLRSPEFLDVERFPEIRFACARIERTTLDEYELAGDLTMRGVTRPVTLVVAQTGRIVDPDGYDRAGFMVAGAISRKDFGLTWNTVLETGGVMVGDRVTFAIELEAVRADHAGGSTRSPALLGG